MGNIVRRVANSESAGEEITTSHEGDGLIVTSQVRLGINPGIHLAWVLVPSYLDADFTIMAFRSVGGFCSEDDPDQLTCHGQMILETQQDGEMEEHLCEGTYFYTFLCRRPSWHGLWEVRSQPLRFRETIPSAQVAIRRMEDQLKFQDLAKQLALQKARHEIEEAEINQKLHEVKTRMELSSKRKRSSRKAGYRKFKQLPDSLLDSMSHTAEYIKSIQKDVRFQRLSPTDQQIFIEIIREMNNPREEIFRP